MITPGFTLEQQKLVVNIMRLDLIATLIFSLSGLVIAALQANQHFLLPAMAPSMYDLGMLFGVVILAPETGYHIGPFTLPAFGLGIYGVVYGTIIGAALFLLIQLPGLVKYKFHWTPAIDLHHPAVRKVLVLMGPRILTVFFIQLIFVARDNIASRLDIGSVSALAYGWLFMQVPETLIGTALATVLLPTISEQVAREQVDAYRQSLNRAIRIILALTIPATVLVAVGIRPLVGMLKFDPSWCRGCSLGHARFSGRVDRSITGRSCCACLLCPTKCSHTPWRLPFYHRDLCHPGHWAWLCIRCSWYCPG